MKDRQGINRGGCRECECLEYSLPSSGNLCDYCGHFPVLHSSLDNLKCKAWTIAASPHSLFPEPNQVNIDGGSNLRYMIASTSTITKQELIQNNPEDLGSTEATNSNIRVMKTSNSAIQDDPDLEQPSTSHQRAASGSAPLKDHLEQPSTSTSKEADSALLPNLPEALKPYLNGTVTEPRKIAVLRKKLIKFLSEHLNSNGLLDDSSRIRQAWGYRKLASQILKKYPNIIRERKARARTPKGELGLLMSRLADRRGKMKRRERIKEDDFSVHAPSSSENNHNLGSALEVSSPWQAEMGFEKVPTGLQSPSAITQSEPGIEEPCSPDGYSIPLSPDDKKYIQTFPEPLDCAHSAYPLPKSEESLITSDSAIQDDSDLEQPSTSHQRASSDSALLNDSDLENTSTQQSGTANPAIPDDLHLEHTSTFTSKEADSALLPNFPEELMPYLNGTVTEPRQIGVLRKKMIKFLMEHLDSKGLICYSSRIRQAWGYRKLATQIVLQYPNVIQERQARVRPPKGELGLLMSRLADTRGKQRRKEHMKKASNSTMQDDPDLEQPSTSYQRPSSDSAHLSDSDLEQSSTSHQRAPSDSAHLNDPDLEQSLTSHQRAASVSTMSNDFHLEKPCTSTSKDADSALLPNFPQELMPYLNGTVTDPTRMAVLRNELIKFLIEHLVSKGLLDDSSKIKQAWGYRKLATQILKKYPNIIRERLAKRARTPKGELGLLMARLADRRGKLKREQRMKEEALSLQPTHFLEITQSEPCSPDGSSIPLNPYDKKYFQTSPDPLDCAHSTYPLPKSEESSISGYPPSPNQKASTTITHEYPESWQHRPSSLKLGHSTSSTASSESGTSVSSAEYDFFRMHSKDPEFSYSSTDEMRSPLETARSRESYQKHKFKIGTLKVNIKYFIAERSFQFNLLNDNQLPSHIRCSQDDLYVKFSLIIGDRKIRCSKELKSVPPEKENEIIATFHHEADVQELSQGSVIITLCKKMQTMDQGMVIGCAFVNIGDLSLSTSENFDSGQMELPLEDCNPHQVMFCGGFLRCLVELSSQGSTISLTNIELTEIDFSAIIPEEENETKNVQLYLKITVYEDGEAVFWRRTIPVTVTTTCQVITLASQAHLEVTPSKLNTLQLVLSVRLKTGKRGERCILGNIYLGESWFSNEVEARKKIRGFSSKTMLYLPLDQ